MGPFSVVLLSLLWALFSVVLLSVVPTPSKLAKCGRCQPRAWLENRKMPPARAGVSSHAYQPFKPVPSRFCDVPSREGTPVPSLLAGLAIAVLSLLNRDSPPLKNPV